MQSKNLFKITMQADYMFAVQDVAINLIYNPPTIKEKKHVYTRLKMIAGFFLTPISSGVLDLSWHVWIMFNV